MAIIETQISHSQHLSPSQLIRNGVPSFRLSDEINNRRKQLEVKDVSGIYLCYYYVFLKCLLIIY